MASFLGTLLQLAVTLLLSVQTNSAATQAQIQQAVNVATQAIQLSTQAISSESSTANVVGTTNTVATPAIAPTSTTSPTPHAAITAVNCDPLPIIPGCIVTASVVNNTCVFNTQCAATSTTVSAPVTVTSVPQISGISPASGPVGTQVTITGTGFTPTGNTIALKGGPANSSLFGNETAIGGKLQFSIPTNANAPTATCSSPNLLTSSTCVFSTTPGNYVVSVTNADGTSNTFTFIVISGT